MSEQDGLSRLTLFLTQTRKQAEQAVDCLNVRIQELEQERDQISGERDYYKNYAEQLRVENSKKWRLQERDDWKALVDSVQKDRSRLHDECHRLEEELHLAQEEILRLEHRSHSFDTELSIQVEAENGVASSNLNGTASSEALQSLRSPSASSCSSPRIARVSSSANDPTRDVLEATRDTTARNDDDNNNDNAGDTSGHDHLLLSSPAGSRTSSPRISSPRGMQYFPSSSHSNPSSPVPGVTRRMSLGGDSDRESPCDHSPRQLVRELRKELAKAHSEIEILRKTAETESLTQEEEILRLRNEVSMLRKQLKQEEDLANDSHSAPLSGGGDGKEVAVVPATQPAKASSGGISSLLNPLSVLGYWFFPSSSRPLERPQPATQRV